MDDWDLDTPPRRSAPDDRSEIAPASSLEPESPALPLPERVKETPAGSGTPVGGEPLTTATASRWGRFWKKVPAARIAAGILLLVVGAIIGLFIAHSEVSGERVQLAEAREALSRVTQALSQSEERNSSYYLANQALEAELEKLQSSGTTGPDATSTTFSPPSSDVGKVYGDGIYIVGEDIAAGTYYGVVTGEVGYWARLKATDGMIASIIANGLPRGPFVLTIITSDRALELRGVEITAR
jgi:hypothetical protein